MPSASAVHEFSGYLPFVRIGPLLVQTYFLIISLTLCIVVLALIRRADRMGFKRNSVLDLALVAMIGGFLGSRFLHVIFEEPRYYLNDPVQILHIERGGFVWYGGLIGGVACGVGLAIKRKWPLLKWFDFVAPLLAFGYGMGRVACFLTGCCFGSVCTLASGFSFRYPTQLFAVVWEFSTLAVLLLIENSRLKMLKSNNKSKWFTKPGAIFWLWICLHSVGRIIMELFRADDRGPLLGALSVSTALSGLFLVLSLGWAFAYLRKTTKET